MSSHKISVDLDLTAIRNVTKELRKEFKVFQLCANKLKSKLPRDTFMNSLDGVLRHIKRTLTLSVLNAGNGIEAMKLSEIKEDEDDISDELEFFAEESYTAATQCTKSFGLCEQRLKLGHFLPNYITVLAILGRLNCLCKSISLLTARLLYRIKLIRLSQDTNQKAQENNLEEYGKDLLVRLGYEETYFNALWVEDEIPFEKLNEEKDIGVVIPRLVFEDVEPVVIKRKMKKGISTSTPGSTKKKSKKMVNKIDSEDTSLLSSKSTIYSKKKAGGQKTPKSLKELRKRLKNVCDLQSFKLTLVDIMNEISLEGNQNRSKLEKLSKAFEKKIASFKEGCDTETALLATHNGYNTLVSDSDSLKLPEEKSKKKQKKNGKLVKEEKDSNKLSLGQEEKPPKQPISETKVNALAKKYANKMIRLLKVKE